MFWTKSRKRGTKNRADNDRSWAGSGLRWCRPTLEQLEDRTLLNVDYSGLSTGLQNIFNGLQTALNGHLWLPSVSFSLPLIGTGLGSGNAQFLTAIANSIKTDITTPPTDAASAQAAITHALMDASDGAVTVTPTANGSDEEDFFIQIKNAALTPTTLFDTGLPGLETAGDALSSLVRDLTHKINVDVTLTYTLNLHFSIATNNGVTTIDLNTTPNQTPNAPLLSMTLGAHLDPNSFSNLTENLGPFSVIVRDNGSGLNATVQFNVSAGTYDSSSFDVTGAASSVAFQSATANTGLGMTVSASPFPSLEADLSVTWPLAGTSDPFDSSSNSSMPGISFNVGLDLSSVVDWLNNVLEPVAQKLGAIKPVINTIESVLRTKIPLLGDLNISGLPKTLEDILLANAPNGTGQEIETFLKTLDVLLSTPDQLLQSLNTPKTPITLASFQLPDPPNNDPRDAGFDLGSLLNALPPQDPGHAQAFLNQLVGLLPGTLDVPLLSDPLDDLKALLLGNNVALVQWKLPDLKIPDLAGISLGPFFIFPPIALKLDLGLGLLGGITVGYDTFGFTSAWTTDATNDNPSLNLFNEGVFIQDAHLAVTGSIGLTAEADLGVAQVGATGSLTLAFGIGGSGGSGLNFGLQDNGNGQPIMGDQDPYHVVTFDGNPENVLQLGDFFWDLVNGGPLCAFNVGGELSASLSVFLTIGVDPFSITFTYDFGSITIAKFTINTCAPTGSPHLVDFGDPTTLNNSLQSQNLPPLPDVDQQFAFDDQNFFEKIPPTTQTTVLLDLGQYQSLRHDVPLDSGGEENFEVSTGKNQSDLLVQGFGVAETLPGLNTNTTTIVAIGDTSTGSQPTKVLIDAGVHANAYLVGGANINSFNYQGDGETYMKGGPATFPLGSGQAQNTLRGGGGANYLVGGDLGPNPPSGTDQPTWNSLRGGPGVNALQGGDAGATMTAGPHNDLLQGGNGASSYILVAGPGDDVLVGGGDQSLYNQFDWNENDGSVQVSGFNINFVEQEGMTTGNVLNIEADKPDETWHLTQNTEGAIVIFVPNSTKSIVASNMDVLSLDDSPAPGTKGTGITYQVDDLSDTHISLIDLNLHEQANPDAYQDQVIVNAPPSADNVRIWWEQHLAGYDQNTKRAVYGATTHVFIITSPTPDTSVRYEIVTAVAKAADSLHVNTFDGNDTVTIEGTQPDVSGGTTGAHVYVNTGAGDDTINVGSPSVGLDDFLGPLDIDAGAGRNQITFDESPSFINDTVTLTASQLIRYTKFAIPPEGDYRGETAYPFIINFKASGGDFSRGVNFHTSTGATNLFIPETGVKAGLAVTADSALAGPPDHIFIGFDGAFPPGQSRVMVQNIGLTPQFPTTIADSVLDLLRSGTIIYGEPAGNTALEVDDEGAQGKETYTLDSVSGIIHLSPSGSSPPLFGFTNGVILRTGVSPVFYNGSSLGMTLNAGNHGNRVLVQGVLGGTTAAINTGNGNDTIIVGDTQNRLDNIGGLLTIDGQGGTNDLTIHDEGNGSGQAYTLVADQLTRLGNPPLSQITITFFHLSSLVFNASNNTQTNSISVNGTPAGVPVTVHAGTGDAGLGVTDFDNIRGALDFQWASGTKQLLADDQPASADNTYKLTNSAASTTLERSNAALVTLAGFLTSATLLPGLLHDNKVQVVSLASGTSATIDAGLGNNAIETPVPRQNLDLLQGALTVLGNGPTQLVLNDQRGTARDYVFTAGGLQFNANLPAIQFSNVAVTLNAAPAAMAEVQGTAQTDTVTVNLAKGQSHVVVGSTAHRLAPVHGPVYVNGRSGSDTLLVDDSGGKFLFGYLTYTITASSIVGGLSTVYFSNMGSVALNGGMESDFYNVKSVPAKTSVTINGQGNVNSLYSPDQANQWQIAGTNTGTLDTRILFNNVQNLVAGSGADNFSFQKSGTLTGSIDGGTGDATLDFKAYPAPVTVALTQHGFLHGVRGGVTALSASLIAQDFDNIDSLIGNAGDTLDTSNLSGDFDTALRVAGFAPLAFNVAGNFSGSLQTPGETVTTLQVAGTVSGGIVAAAVNSATIGGDFTGQIVVAAGPVNLSVTGATAATAHVWIERLGAFTVTDGALVGQSATNIATINGLNERDTTIQASVTLAAGQSAGLLARFSGPADSNYYEARLTDAGNGIQATIYRNHNGTLTRLVSKTISVRGIGPPILLLKFKLVGSTLGLYLGNVLVETATDATLTSGGVGVRLGMGAAVTDVF
jgi:hypothetical protein